MKILVGFLWIFLFCYQYFLGVASTVFAEVDKPTVKIGAILPLSGELAHLGEAYRDAILLAISDLPKSTKYQYEAIFEDNHLNLKTTAAAAKKLSSIDSVHAIISMWSNQGRVVDSIIKETELIHFGCAWDRSVASSPLSFNLSGTPDYFMHHFIKALQKRKIKRIKLIELNDSGSIAAHDELARQLEGTGIKIVFRQQFDSGDRDFRTMLLRSKKIQSDVYYRNAGSPELELITKQLRQLGIVEPIITIGTFDFTTNLDLFNGSWYMTMTWPSYDFQKRYTKLFKRPVMYQLGNFYDMIGIIVKGFETAGDSSNIPSGTYVAKAISQIKTHRGVLGDLTQQADGTFQSEPSFFIVKNGTRESISG